MVKITMNATQSILEGLRIIDGLASTARWHYYGFLFSTLLLICVFVLEVLNFNLFGWVQRIALIGLFVTGYYAWNPINKWKT